MKHSALLSYNSMSYKRFKTKYSGKFLDLGRVNEGSEQLRMLHNEELRNLYRLRSILGQWILESCIMLSGGYRDAYKILGRKPLTLFCLAKRGDGRNFTRCFKKLTGDNIPLTYNQRIFIRDRYRLWLLISLAQIYTAEQSNCKIEA